MILYKQLVGQQSCAACRQPLAAHLRPLGEAVAEDVVRHLPHGRDACAARHHAYSKYHICSVRTDRCGRIQASIRSV